MHMVDEKRLEMRDGNEPDVHGKLEKIGVER